MSDWQNLSDQLRKLGVKLGANKNDLASPKKHWPLETVLDCTETQTPTGMILSVKRELPIIYAQGNVKLAPTTRIDTLLRWANIPMEEMTVGLENLVFLDTETTGLSGGTGTMAFMVGVGKFVGDQFVLEQFFLRNPSEEEAFLYALSLFCKDMKAVVSYNGKAFDIPILNTRHIIQRVPSPFLDAFHIDLLTISRQIWRLRLSQCRLADIERHILGFQREGGEVPGYLAPEFYKDYLRTGDARPLKGVFYHNQEDVVSLAALLSLVAKILEVPSPEVVSFYNDMFSIGRVFEKMEDFETAHQLYAQSYEGETDQTLAIQYLMRHAALLKKSGDLDQALNLWNQAAELNHFETLVILAKHHEHKTKQLDLAITLTQRALDCLSGEGKIKPSEVDKLNHRKTRLIRKLEQKKNN